MVEKVVRSLADLQEALALAARDGSCRIRVGDQVAALVAGEDLSDEEAQRCLSHPQVAQRLTNAVRSLEEGRGMLHEEVLKRFGQRQVSHPLGAGGGRGVGRSTLI